ncbi:MAG TPA: MarR family transcriptional regulator [Chthoniobacterales bacterium]
MRESVDPLPQGSTHAGTRGVHVWLILMKAHRALRRHAEASLAELGFGLSDFGTLEVLLHKGPLPVCEIARLVGLTPGSASVALDRLEKRGLIERQADVADRRNRIIHLTGAGRQLIDRAFTDHAQAMEAAAGPLAPEERATLIRLLKKLGKGAQAQRSAED